MNHGISLTNSQAAVNGNTINVAGDTGGISMCRKQVDLIKMPIVIGVII